MKRIIVATLLTIIFAFTPTKTKAPDPNRRFKVTLDLPLNSYQTLLTTISQSQVMSASDANQLNQLILSQLNPQIVAQNKQDSIESANSPHNTAPKK